MLSLMLLHGPARLNGPHHDTAHQLIPQHALQHISRLIPCDPAPAWSSTSGACNNLSASPLVLRVLSMKRRSPPTQLLSSRQCSMQAHQPSTETCCIVLLVSCVRRTTTGSLQQLAECPLRSSLLDLFGCRHLHADPMSMTICQ